MQNVVKDNYTVSGFFVFFLIHASIFGVGALSYQHFVFEFAGNDAWISVLLMGLSLHLIIWMIFKMLGNPAKDVIDLHRILFGKFLGNAISLIFVCYYFILALTVFRGYIEIIQIWMFPNLRTWILATLFIIVIYYVVSGGFRVIAGFCLFGVIFSWLLPLLLYFNIKYGHFTNVLPMFNHSINDLLTSSKNSGIMFIGFEGLLIYFPFIKSPKKNVKWAHLSLFLLTLKYSVLIFVTIMYFGKGLLKHTYWPTLVMIKVIEFSIIARIEFIFICIWFMIIISMSCTRIIKRVTKLKPTLSLLLILVALFLATLPLNDRVKIEWLGKNVVEIGFYCIYVYIPLLFILSMIRSKISQKKTKTIQFE